MENKIDLENVAKVAAWIRRSQVSHKEGISSIFGGHDENTTNALEAIPRLVAALKSSEKVLTELVNDGFAVEWKLDKVKSALQLFTTENSGQ